MHKSLDNIKVPSSDVGLTCVTKVGLCGSLASEALGCQIGLCCKGLTFAAKAWDTLHYPYLILSYLILPYLFCSFLFWTVVSFARRTYDNGKMSLLTQHFHFQACHRRKTVFLGGMRVKCEDGNLRGI